MGTIWPNLGISLQEGNQDREIYRGEVLRSFPDYNKSSNQLDPVNQVVQGAHLIQWVELVLSKHSAQE